MGNIRTQSRAVATLAALGALTLGLTAPSSAAPATTDPAPAEAGATWLSGQLTKGLVHNEQFDFDDVGLSIDVALGLDAAGQQPDLVDTITKAVRKQVTSYTSFAPNVYAGATAKALVLAISQDRNPHRYGGLDLLGVLEGRVSTAAPIAGRIEDAYDPNDQFGGDFANVLGQAYAAQALSLAGSSKAASATAFLLQQQCDKGYFRQSFTADKTRADQSCQGAPAAERGSSTDATAQAVLALQDVKGGQAKAAVKKAVAWLEDTQLADGSFTDSGKKKGIVNTNSTGLAGWALGVTGSPAATDAAAFVRKFQVAANPCAGKLADDAGAIAYDVTTYEAGVTKGIKVKTSDQWRRASAQALPVLQWAPAAAGKLAANGPSSVAGGSTFKLALTGVAPGERVCVVRGGTAAEYVPGKNALTNVKIVAPHGTTTRTWTVYAGTDSVVVRARVTG